MTDIIGPTIKVIPAHSYLSCFGCKFFWREMIKSGKDPLYQSTCSHPRLDEMISFDGNLPNGDHTPNWCPAKKDGDK